MMQSVILDSAKNVRVPEIERSSESSRSNYSESPRSTTNEILKPFLRRAVDTIRLLRCSSITDKSIARRDLREAIGESETFLKNINANFCYVTVPFNMTNVYCTNVDFSNAILINAYRCKGKNTLRGYELKNHLEAEHTTSERKNKVATALFTVRDAIDFFKNTDAKNLEELELNTLKVRIIQSVSCALNQGSFGISNLDRTDFILEANAVVQNLSTDMIKVLGGLQDLDELNGSLKL